jgi:hypothetical protein
VRAKLGVPADEGAVEVDREGGDPYGEACRKLDGYGGVPPVDFTT